MHIYMNTMLQCKFHHDKSFYLFCSPDFSVHCIGMEYMLNITIFPPQNSTYPYCVWSTLLFPILFYFIKKCLSSPLVGHRLQCANTGLYSTDRCHGCREGSKGGLQLEELQVPLSDFCVRFHQKGNPILKKKRPENYSSKSTPKLNKRLNKHT